MTERSKKLLFGAPPPLDWPHTPGVLYAKIDDITEPVLKLVANHLIKKWNDESIPVAWLSKGGWEGWLQVELTLMLMSELKTDEYTVDREVKTWSATGKNLSSDEDRGKCDITVRPTKAFMDKVPVVKRDSYILELKTDGGYLGKEADKAARMARDDFIDDMKKVNMGLIEDVLKSFNGTKLNKFCIGITCNAEDLTYGWRDIQRELGPVNYIWLTTPKQNGERPNRLAMFWWDAADAVKNMSPPVVKPDPVQQDEEDGDSSDDEATKKRKKDDQQPKKSEPPLKANKKDDDPNTKTVVTNLVKK